MSSDYVTQAGPQHFLTWSRLAEQTAAHREQNENSNQKERENQQGLTETVVNNNEEGLQTIPAMANFMENLWGSVFTAGPTPTLLIATNATFAALQLLLGALFIATYSIHFAILSILCIGLWFSINWFANELRQAQAKEEEAERLRQRKATTKADKDWKAKGEVGDSADDEGEDTETETEGQGMRESGSSAAFEPNTEDEARGEETMSVISGGGTAGLVGASTGLQAGDASSASRQRRADDGDRSGEVSSSTDSEWEKVEGDR